MLSGADASTFTIDQFTGLVNMVPTDFENPEDGQVYYPIGVINIQQELNVRNREEGESPSLVLAGFTAIH